LVETSEEGCGSKRAVLPMMMMMMMMMMLMVVILKMYMLSVVSKIRYQGFNRRVSLH
jgi:hypothetical protein